jgi:hypothetical protein
VSDTHADVQWMVSVVKMATVLEGYTTEKQRYFVGKSTHEKDVRKEMFSVCGGKCFSLKAVHNWFEKFSQ